MEPQIPLYGRHLLSTQMLEESLLGVGAVLRLGRDVLGKWKTVEGKQQMRTPHHHMARWSVARSSALRVCDIRNYSYRGA